MPAISRLPDDILSSIFEFHVLQLVLLSHVCQHWGYIALRHKTFWGTAVISQYMPVLDFFFSRLAQAQLRLGPIDITVLLDLRPPKTQEQLSLMELNILPALSATMSHIVSLNLEVPPALAKPMFDALHQPAPMLRRFDVINLQIGAPVCIPPDLFASSAPQLTKLILGHGVQLPDQPVASFRSVEFLVCLMRSGTGPTGIGSILDWFPSLRHLDTCGRKLTTDSLSRLAVDYLSQLSRLESLGLHMAWLKELNRIGTARRVLAQTRIFRLHLLMPQRSDNEPPAPGLSASAAALLLPPSSEELYCWVHCDGTSLAFPTESPGPLFMRLAYGLCGATRDPSPAFGLFTAYPNLVALSVGIELWDDLCACTYMLPVLEVLVIVFSVTVTMRVHLPWRLPHGRLIPSPRLRTVILHFRPRCEAGPSTAGPVTCRSVDSLLRETFATDDWTSVEVLLVNVRLYGAATVPSTKISGVRVASTEECCALGPRVATLLGHIHDVGRPLL